MKYKSFNFGKRLKEYRKSKNITQEKLAEKTGMRPGYISNVETGERSDPRLSTLLKILNGLDAGFDELAK
mgnify:CR=1 FL=1